MTARGAGAAGEESPGRAGPDRLTEPLALRGRSPGDIPLLTALQPNILRPHVRDSLRLLLIRIDDAGAARRSLARIARDDAVMKSAAAHFDELQAHRAAGTKGTAFVGVALSRTGYERLGVPDDRQPGDEPFRAGMGARRERLSDPDPCGWEHTDRLDGMLLVGSDAADLTDERGGRLEAALDGITVFATQDGATLRNKQGVAIENFGYVDGRSQPLFIHEDAERERDTTDGISVWDPLVPLDRVLVRDPGVPDTPDCYGSYLVYRKLEQNVKAFKAKEDLVAQALALSRSDAERAGAMLVGRFEDGTPVAIQAEGTEPTPVPNNFTYADDEHGNKCPHFAHIRVMNGRRDGPFERVVIARRGQAYGARPDIGDPSLPPPTAGVGLLFMAVVSDIERQFEALQRAANGSEHGAGDPVIGQGRPGGAPLRFPRVWGGDEKISTGDGLARAVTMRGGEYLFLPSLTFLRHLDDGT